MSGFLVLSIEAVRDAARRRIVAVVIVLSFLSLLGIDGCTSCAGQVTVNGQTQEMGELAGITGTLTFGILGFWCILLAGVLAAEHLAQTLIDGSANLTLARPVGRSAFALARLAGALSIALIMTAVLLGATAGLLFVRGSLSLGPPAVAAGVVVLGSVTIGALSMAASLYLPRVACMLLSVFALASTGLANLVGLFGETKGVLGGIDAAGPPILGALALALDPWIPQVEVPGDPVMAWIRLGVWAVGSVALLALAFRRLELGR
ncbi:MAG: hypothetical protein QNK05_07450 [Myxococcota bacterium]|nr:hypothetical protein [Myxococcota bacterium]